MEHGVRRLARPTRVSGDNGASLCGVRCGLALRRVTWRAVAFFLGWAFVRRRFSNAVAAGPGCPPAAVANLFLRAIVIGPRGRVLPTSDGRVRRGPSPGGRRAGVRPAACPERQRSD